MKLMKLNETTVSKVKNYTKKAVVPATMLLVLSGSAFAGTDNTFDAVFETLKGWAEGSLGKVFAIAAFLIGMGIGLVRQNAMAVVLGLGIALIMFYGPTIIESLITYAIP